MGLEKKKNGTGKKACPIAVEVRFLDPARSSILNIFLSGLSALYFTRMTPERHDAAPELYSMMMKQAVDQGRQMNSTVELHRNQPTVAQVRACGGDGLEPLCFQSWGTVASGLRHEPNRG